MGNQCCDNKTVNDSQKVLQPHQNLQTSPKHPKQRSKPKNLTHLETLQTKRQAMIKSKEERNLRDQQKLAELKRQIQELKKEDNKSSKYEFEMKKLMRQKESLEKLISQRNQQIRVIEDEEDNRM